MDGLPEDMWSPYKFLYKIIEKTLANPTDSSSGELERCLKKYKQNLTSLLRNPPKNERSRNQLRSGVTEGITLGGQNRTVILSKDLVDECLIISDMFDLNEFIALELLCTAQRQMTQHPGLPRGLVAIMLYYDGRKAIANSLRDLFQVTSGVSWVTEVPKQITILVSTFTQCLVEDSNVLERIIDLLEDLDISKESVLLTKNRAFGPKKHQNQVLGLFEDIRLALAMALFNWSAQRGLPKTVVVRLIQLLARYKPTEASGTIDDVTLTLLMALLYAYDTSVLHRQEDNSAAVQSLPVMNEPEFVQHIFNALMSESEAWECKDRLDSVAKFALGLSLASLRHAPHNIQNSLSTIIERDEQLIDDAIASKIFEYLFYYILEKDLIFKNEFFYRRVHMLFTDFIDFMHSKVTELRGRADDTARIVLSFAKEGLEPPTNLDHNFEMLLLCIGKFYKDNRSGLSLCIEYWGPLDVTTNYSKATTRSVSLFKFIRLAGELLPQTLFVPYLKMIAGLTSCERSARNAFNLLKQSSGLSGSATLSWEHFFSSLARYYTNLRQEQYPTSDTIYRNRAVNRSISPQEIEGLHAVLGVVKAVVNYDEIARIAISEHPNWAPLHTLLGLLGCSVPLAFKADILKTLAALAKSKETALPLWHLIESSQIIATIPTTNAYGICNLEIEIDQSESRIESYPLSQAVLELLHSLVSTAIPKNLGGGPRKPGLDPYITFVVNSIFLKFYNRVYKNEAEKWMVGEKCLKLLHYLLCMYEVTPDDFDEDADKNPQAGFHIMLQLHTKSEMLRLLLLIIDETCVRLDEYNKFHGKDTLERCALLCLQMLEVALEKQDHFFEAHSVACSSTLLSGLNRLLLDVNPRTRNPDHVVHTTKFITYSSWLPRHTLVAIKILRMVARQPKVTFQILGIFAQNEQLLTEIRQGFVECLEADVLLTTSANSDEDTDVTTVRSRTELCIKAAIIDLLKSCLPGPAPNLSHFLLGFDTTKELSHGSSRQRLGVIDAHRNCSKSLIALLDNHLETMITCDVFNIAVERVMDDAYHMLYMLCSNQRTSETILRYLRSCNDFLSRQLAALPFKHSTNAHVLNQMSNLIRCAAIELKITSSNCQISRIQHMCELLVGTSEKGAHETANREYNHSYGQPGIATQAGFAEALLQKNLGEKRSNFLLCYLLDHLNFAMTTLPIPKWDFFDNALTTQILHECEKKTAHGNKLIDIKKLNEILRDELHTVQNTIASGQRKLIMDEIEAVLLYAIDLNEERNKNYATVQLIDAWGQLSEVLFSCVPEPALSMTTKQDLILELLQKLLAKLIPVQPIFELSILASGTILLLLVNLRYYYANDLDQSDTNFESFDNSHTEGLGVSSTKSNSLNLKSILKSLLEWIILSGVGSQKLRTNLYAALLNCLRIVKGSSLARSEDHSNDFYVSRLDKTVGRTDRSEGESSFIRMFVEAFLEFGDKLTDIICHDCIAGIDICKMLALSCIDALLELDSMSGVIHFIANRGYLSNITASLLKSDESLCLILCNVPENMKALYVYESQMAALLRVACSHVGAELLLGEKLLGALSSMKVFDMHPDFPSNTFRQETDKAFVPSVDARFRNILFPALKLCECIISTLGTENHSAISQVTHFVLAHCDMIETVLRTGTPFMELGLLQELAAITGLIARITNQEMFSLCNRNSSQDIGVNLYRIQRLMLSTFARFIVSESTFRDMLNPENTVYEPTDENQTLHVKYFLEIAANLSLYCRNAIANHSADHRANVILFSPSLTDNLQRGESRNNTLKMTQSLALILNQLRGSVEYFNQQRCFTDSVRSRSSRPNIRFDENSGGKQNELSLCTFISEQCLYLLWIHLDFYMRRVHVGSLANGTYAPETLNGMMISLDDISALKKNLISMFNETFCMQLLATSESEKELDRGFTEALLRRIKSLIQFVPVN